MSLFAAAAAVGAAAQDVIFGETIGFAPQVDDESSEIVSAGDDPTRPARDLVGIYDEDTVIAHSVGSGANSHDSADVTAAKAQVEFDLALFASPADRPVQGDRLILKDRAGLPRLQVVSSRPDDVGRLICLVVPLGSAP